jgi:hypothetical protein
VELQAERIPVYLVDREIDGGSKCNGVEAGKEGPSSCRDCTNCNINVDNNMRSPKSCLYNMTFWTELMTLVSLQILYFSLHGQPSRRYKLIITQFSRPFLCTASTVLDFLI